MALKLAVIGAGMASGRAMEHLLEANDEIYDITLFSAEPRGNYNRIMLSPVLSGEKSYEEIVTHDANWYESHGVDCRFGERVTSVDRMRKVVITEKSETPYDKLLIATGSNPFIIPIPGRNLEGVMAYRDLGDVNKMLDYSKRPDAWAVVIGGGLLGLEAAAGLSAQGMKVRYPPDAAPDGTPVGSIRWVLGCSENWKNAGSIFCAAQTPKKSLAIPRSKKSCWRMARGSKRTWWFWPLVSARISVWHRRRD